MRMPWKFCGAAACAVVLACAPQILAAGPAAAPAPVERRDDFSYGPLRFRVESLALDGSVAANTKISIENMTRSTARVVLASTAAARNSFGLELTSAAGAQCDALSTDIAGIKVVASEGETKVKEMTPIPPLAKLVFTGKLHCNTGHLSTSDVLNLRGRILTATEAGGFDIPLSFTGLKATAK